MDIEQESVILKLYEKVEQEKSTSKEYKALLSKYNVLRNKFDDKMTQSQMEDLINLLQIRDDMESVETKDYFIEGFKLATRLMAEVFYKEDN